MLEEMQRTLQEAGKEVHFIRTADLQMRHCTGCMYCRSKHACCLPEDDSVRVLEELQVCELLIIGAPCYWGNIPGELKILFDRLVYGMMDEDKRGIPIGLMKGKRAAIVSTSTTFWPFNIWFHQTRGVVRALKEILKWSGAAQRSIRSRRRTCNARADWHKKSFGEKSLTLPQQTKG